MVEDVVCPFCEEDGFDLIGLKLHFLNGWCEAFMNLDINEVRLNTHGV